MSEMRRAARRMVEARSETFESRHALGESQRRLEAALAKIAPSDREFRTAWSTGAQRGATLTVTFPASRRTLRFLKLLSVALFAVVGGALASWFMATPATAWALTLGAIFAFVGFPFVILGVSSHQDAAESVIRRAIRVALQGEEEDLPPPQRWPDEE